MWKVPSVLALNVANLVTKLIGVFRRVGQLSQCKSQAKKTLLISACFAESDDELEGVFDVAPSPGVQRAIGSTESFPTQRGGVAVL